MVNILKKVKKNGFPSVFSKSDLTGVGSFFPIFFSEKAEHPKISSNQTMPANPLPYLQVGLSIEICTDGALVEISKLRGVSSYPQVEGTLRDFQYIYPG